MAAQRGMKRRRKKADPFAGDKINMIDYKDVSLLKKYISERGKILPRRMTGACAKHQRYIAMQIKRARFMALIPFVK
mgnify:CR=1 FL=1